MYKICTSSLFHFAAQMHEKVRDCYANIDLYIQFLVSTEPSQIRIKLMAVTTKSNAYDEDVGR